MGVPEILSEVAKLSATERRWLITSIQTMPPPARQPKAGEQAGKSGGGGGGDAKVKGKGPAKKTSIHAGNPLYQALKEKEQDLKVALKAVSTFEGEDKTFPHLLEVVRELVGEGFTASGDEGKQTASDRRANAIAASLRIQDDPTLEKSDAWKAVYNPAFRALSALEEARIAWIFRSSGPQANPETEPPGTSGEGPSQSVPAEQGATPAEQESTGKGEAPGKGRGKRRSGGRGSGFS